jgi:hypothetical protein
MSQTRDFSSRLWDDLRLWFYLIIGIRMNGSFEGL